MPEISSEKCYLHYITLEFTAVEYLKLKLFCSWKDLNCLASIFNLWMSIFVLQNVSIEEYLLIQFQK